MCIRISCLFLLAMAGCGKPSPSAPAAQELRQVTPPEPAAERKLAPDEAKRLVADAASVKRDELEKLVAGPESNIEPGKLDNLPLTILCYLLKGPVDFQAHVQHTSFPQFAATLGKNNDDGRISIIQPEQVTRCHCVTNGDTAKGSVEFKASNAYEGRTEFVARFVEGQWRIEELWLPSDKIGVSIGQNGKWQITQRDD